jgi:hypothetical protein
MARIAALDERLAEKQLRLTAVERATFPERYAALHEKRLALMGTAVEEALQSERRGQRKAARLARAFITTDGGESEDDGYSDADGGGGEPRPGSVQHALQRPRSGLHAAHPSALGPEEEALVERLLARGEEELDCNPYALPGLEAELLVLEHGEPSHADAPAGGARPRGHGGLIGFGDDASSVRSAAPSSTAASSRAPGPVTGAARTRKGRAAGSAAAEVTAAASAAAGAEGPRREKVDYLRPARVARELAEAERELDARLRALRTSDLNVRADAATIKFLLAQAQRELYGDVAREPSSVIWPRRRSSGDGGSEY